MSEHSHSMSDGSDPSAAKYPTSEFCSALCYTITLPRRLMTIVHINDSYAILSALAAVCHNCIAYLSLEVIAKLQRALLSIYADKVGLITEV